MIAKSVILSRKRRKSL